MNFASSKPTVLTRQISRKPSDTSSDTLASCGTTFSCSSHFGTSYSRTFGAHVKRPLRCCSAA